MDSFLLSSSAVRKVWLHFHLHKSSAKKKRYWRKVYLPTHSAPRDVRCALKWKTDEFLYHFPLTPCSLFPPQLSSASHTTFIFSLSPPLLCLIYLCAHHTCSPKSWSIQMPIDEPVQVILVLLKCKVFYPFAIKLHLHGWKQFLMDKYVNKCISQWLPQDQKVQWFWLKWDKLIGNMTRQNELYLDSM